VAALRIWLDAQTPLPSLQLDKAIIYANNQLLQTGLCDRTRGGQTDRTRGGQTDRAGAATLIVPGRPN
jgi:hypothetical protein